MFAPYEILGVTESKNTMSVIFLNLARFHLVFSLGASSLKSNLAKNNIAKG